jgi:tetratricopeptide (TPR) repeat protein
MSRPVRPKHPPRVLKSKRLLVVLAVVVAFAGVTMAAYFLQAGRQAEQWRDRAREASKERDFAQAVEFYDRYLSYKPADAADVRFELAAVYDEYARGSIARPREAWRLWDKSLEEYNMALQAQPGRNKERQQLAELYLLLGKPGFARKEVEYLRKDPALRDDPKLFELLALCDDGTTTADKKAVAEHLRAAVNTGKAGPEVYLRLAVLLKRDLGTPDAQKQADDLMDKLLTDKKGQPDDLVAHLAYARYQTEFDRRHRAREAIESAYRSIPGGRENVDVVLAHADAVAADDLTEARNILDRGVRLHPDNALLGMGLAEVENRTGNRDAARTQLTAVFARLPDGDPLALEVGDRLLDLGDAETATRAAAKLDANPLVAPLSSYLRGRVKLAHGDWPAALPLLRQAVLAINASLVVKRKPPMLHKAYTALGTAYGLANDPEQQADAFHRAAKADETSVAARVAYADALAKLNRGADAEREYAAVAGSSPAARAALANMKLVEELAGPAPVTGGRNLPAFWAQVGRGPYPPELAPAVATAFAAEGKVDEAEKVLAAAVQEKPTPQAYALLAALRGARGRDAAFAVLDQADKALGPTADVQLARAAVLAREPKPDTAAIAALASNDHLSAGDRKRLKPAVGELLLSLGAADKGLPLLLEAAAEQKYDLGVRVVLFDWALAKKDAKLRDRMLGEIRTLDTDPDAADGNTLGGIALVAGVMHELAENPKPSREVNDRLTGTLVAAEKKRKGWSRIPRMRGILASAADRPEEAARFYDEAVRLGDRSEPLVRELVRLYFRKERYADAQRVLAFVRGKGPLSPELEQQYQVLLSVAGGEPTKALARALSKEMVESNSFQDHVLRAQVLARFGKEEEAKQALDSALKLSPAAPEVFVAKLRVLLVLGHSADRLRPEIEAAAKVLRAGNPANPAAAPLALGQMWEMVGDADAAIREYTAAMAAAPADREAPALLLAAYRRGNNTAAADSLLGKLAAGTDPDLRRWAKRMQAAALAAGPDSIANVPRAIQLLDENIAEADRGEDRRARAFVLCADPLQRRAGLGELKALRAREPLSADDTFRLAGVLIEGAKFADAEKELSGVTTAGLLADPAHLVLLAQVQLLKNDLTAAGRTVARLKAIAPNRPDVKLEEARLLAKSNPAKAAALVLTIPTTEPPARQSLQHAQWLEGVGCVEQAEKQYDEYFRGTDPLPDRLTAVAEFFARTGRGDKALSLVKEADGKEGVTPELAARLMVAAVRGRPVPSVPPAQKAEWEKAVEGVVKYVDEKAGANPSGAWALWQAELADGRGDQPKALTLYDAARDAFARDPSANGKFGQAVALNNRVALRTLSIKDGTADLLRQANEVISLVGPRAFALDTRGVVLLHSGKAAEALPDFEAAVAYAASPATLFHLAQCYRKLGKSDEAADAIERAKLLGLKKASLHPLEAKDYDAVVK